MGLLACLCPMLALSAKDDPVLMRIGGHEVPLSEFEYACRRTLRTSTSDPVPLKELARSYADFQLKVQAARRAGLDTLPDFCHRLETYRARLSLTYLTDSATLDRALHRRYSRLAARGPRVQVRQIFCRLPQNATGESLREATARMDSIYKALCQAGPDSFDSFVERYSDDKAVRWLLRLDETAEFEDSVWALKPDTFSRPFFTPRGLHIVKLLQQQAVPPFEAMRDSLLQACPECLEEAARKQASLLSATRQTALTDKQVREVLATECARLEYREADFRLAVQAYADSLLALAATKREIPAHPDSTTLQHYFGRHHDRYDWDMPRYRGIVLLCSSRRVAKRARKMLKHLPAQDWLDAIRLLLNKEDTLVLAHQGTFAPGQDAWVDEHIFKQGKAPERPGYEHVVLLGRKLKGPENYREVEQTVVSDWQIASESRWLSALRNANKVEINQEVLKTVNYHRNKR